MSSAPLFAGLGANPTARAPTDEWLTPPFILEALGGWSSFDLDPCSPIDRPWPTAREHFTVADNGLLRAWHGRVWCNPPYGPVIGRWLGRLAAHGRGIGLIFARTETGPFCRFVWERASALLFLEGRLTFHTVDGRPGAGNGGAPSVLCAYGAKDADVLASCSLAGAFVPLRLPRAFAVAVAFHWNSIVAPPPSDEGATWRDEVVALVRRRRGPVFLADLYRAFAGHPKAKANRNYQAKIRQVLQQGPFRRVDRGQWEAAT